LAEWSLLTNHARLLLAIEHEPGLRQRDMAQELGLTERGVALILRDLRNAGYITGTREGRRVYYSVDPTKPLRTDSIQHHTVGELLELLTEAEESDRERTHA
jgi:DNA-binding MarR family transcriptional regulator